MLSLQHGSEGMLNFLFMLPHKFWQLKSKITNNYQSNSKFGLTKNVCWNLKGKYTKNKSKSRSRMGLDLLLRNYRVTYYSSPFNCSGVRSSSRSLPRQQKATTSWPGCRPTQALSMLQRACPWGSTHIFPANTTPFFENNLQLIESSFQYLSESRIT